MCELDNCPHLIEKLTERENLQNSDSPFRFVFGDFVSAHAIISSNTALGMSTNFCLVLLLLLDGPLVQKKKSWREIWELVGHCTNWQMA